LQPLVYIRMWGPAVGNSAWERQVPLRSDYGRSPHAYVNQRLQIQLELPMMSGVPSKHVEPLMNGGILTEIAVSKDAYSVAQLVVAFP
jgi:hypothetical protein